MHAVTAPTVALERLLGLPSRLGRSRQSAGDVDRDDLVPVPEEGLVDGDEVADRGLGGGWELLGRPELVEEPVVVDDVGLALRTVGAEVHVQRDHPNALRVQDVRRDVGRGVRDDGDARHRRRSLHRPYGT